MSEVCPKCGGGPVECIGYHAYQIAIDDAVEVSMMLCRACDYEWES